MSRLEKIRNNVFSKGNSYGADVEIVDDGECHEVVLHRGCTSRFRENELIDSVSSCLEKLGVDFSVLSDETCCGLMLYDLGDEESGDVVVKNNVEKFNRHGVKKIITICPGCYESFTKYYSRNPDFDVEVIFALDLFNDFGVDGTGFTVHDPCHALERSGQVRSIVRNVPVERANSCCGFGVGLKTGDKNLALEASKKALSHGKVITYCPSCYHTLNRVDSERTFDIFSLIDESL